MDDKYLVQFVTLLGSAVASILLAIEVWFNRVSIIRAMIILIIAIVVFFILGKIIYKTYIRFHADVLKREQEEKDRVIAERIAEEERKEAGIEEDSEGKDLKSADEA